MIANWRNEVRSNDSDWAELDDQALLSIYQTGKPEQRNQAFEVIYNRYGFEVANYVEKNVAEEWKAKKVFCDVWLKASDKFKTFVWKNKPLNRWLMSTAKYTVLEGYRQAKKRDKIEIITDFTDSATDGIEKAQTEPDIVVEELLQNEADQRVLQIINLLEHDLQRKILILRYFSGLKFNKIAEELGKSAGTIRVNHSRALDKLAKHLSDNRIKGE